jgi:hypothetical protein
MSPFHRAYRPALLSLLAVMPVLSACSDTVVFGAQREIDVAISLNEDVAEPVQVNIGLNSQIAALIPPVGDNNESTASGEATASSAAALEAARQHFNPEGEAATIFSGFRYTSSSMLVITPTSPLPKYDAEIRSQFASGAAAVILAKSPKAVAHVVDVAITFDRQPGFLDQDAMDLRASLHKKVDGLTTGKVAELYQNPPTTDPKIEVPMLTSDVIDRCKVEPECRLNVTHVRLNTVETLQELQRWEAAINS